MRVPYSWLQDYVALPDGTTAFEVADRLTRTGGGNLRTIERIAEDCGVGTDAVADLGLIEEVIDFEVTLDRGYMLSMRGAAREAATVFDVPFQDPAMVPVPEPGQTGCPVDVQDSAGCDVLVARTVTGIDPRVPSPPWMRRRLQMSGMRPVSLVVDVTTYVMLELGQPFHIFDRARLSGPIVVRRARAGEELQTAEGLTRRLDSDDLLIADDSGPIGLAGVETGTPAQIADDSTEVVIVSAHFDAGSIARTARRYEVMTDASFRSEHGTDPDVAAPAAQRVVDLLVEVAGAVPAGVTAVGESARPPAITIPWRFPGRVAGVEYTREETERRLRQVGCDLASFGDADLVVRPPSWRPDLRDPSDLAEEVIRLEGFDRLPSTLPRAAAGTGYTHQQRIRRRVGTALASAGYAEVIAYPFLGQADLDALGLPENDPRRTTVRLANPIFEEQPSMRTTLLPGLLAALRRNIERESADVALFEQGSVFRPSKDTAAGVPRLTVERRPTDAEFDALDAALPVQPRRVAVVLSGLREPAGWWGPGRPSGWQDAIEAARIIADACRVELEITQDQHEPWHPGRCARLAVNGRLVGHAGELHPRVVAELGLPPRTAAMELELDRMIPAEEVLTQAPRISSMPVATQDVALVVDAAVAEHEVEAALREGAGELLESLRLCDVYTGDRIGEGRKSLAFALRFRAADRTLTAEEASEARERAVALAGSRTGAALRS